MRFLLPQGPLPFCFPRLCRHQSPASCKPQIIRTRQVVIISRKSAGNIRESHGCTVENRFQRLWRSYTVTALCAHTTSKYSFCKPLTIESNMVYTDAQCTASCSMKSDVNLIEVCVTIDCPHMGAGAITAAVAVARTPASYKY